jgi:hypothetical protein
MQNIKIGDTVWADLGDYIGPVKVVEIYEDMSHRGLNGRWTGVMVSLPTGFNTEYSTKLRHPPIAQRKTTKKEELPLIPEIDIKIKNVEGKVQARKLKARWSPQLTEDFDAYHSMDRQRVIVPINELKEIPNE